MAEYKYNHIVPRTYLEAWNDAEDKIWVYEEDILFKHQNASKVLGHNNFYVKKILGEGLSLTEADRALIFKPLEEYVIKLDGDILDTPSDFYFEYNRFDEWDIRKEDGNLAKKKMLKNSIEQKRIVRLEKNWDKYEKNWLKVREKIEKVVAEDNVALEETDAINLKEFIFSLIFRTKAMEKELDVLVDTIFKISGMDIMLDDEYGETQKKFSRNIFLNLIDKIQINDIDSPYRKVYDDIMNLNLVFYMTNGTKVFITSDNPILKVTDNSFYKGEKTGMYLPIIPHIMCRLFAGNDSAYAIRRLSDIELKRFNKLIRENAFKYVVASKERKLT